MAIIQPNPTDTLGSDNHALMHQVFAIDSSAPPESVVVSSAGQVLLNPIRLASGTSISNPLTSYILTATNISRNVVLLQTGTGAATITLDTGTNLTSAIPNVVPGQMLPFVIANASTQTLLVNGTSGTSIFVSGTSLPVTTLQTRTFWAICGGTNSWNIY